MGQLYKLLFPIWCFPGRQLTPESIEWEVNHRQFSPIDHLGPTVAVRHPVTQSVDGTVQREVQMEIYLMQLSSEPAGDLAYAYGTGIAVW